MLFAISFSIAQKVRCVNQTDFTQSEYLSCWSCQVMQTSDRMVNKSQCRESETAWVYEHCSSFQPVNKIQVRGTTAMTIRHISTQHFKQRRWVHDLCDSRAALLAKSWVSLETPLILYSHREARQASCEPDHFPTQGSWTDYIVTADSA